MTDVSDVATLCEHFRMGVSMNDARTLQSLFQSGALLHPTEGVSIVDFARDLHHLAGSSAEDDSNYIPTILKDLGCPRHLVFLLIDGLGMNFIEGMHRDAFIPGHVVGEMRSVFPSTTPTVLTSLATGQWPAQHAIMGWHTMLPEIQGVSTIIRYQRCPDEVSLSKLGVTPDQAYPLQSQLPSSKSRRRATYLVPEEIAGTAYSRYWSAGALSRGYKSITGAVNLAAKRATGGGGETFTYIYMPQLDRAAHQHGTRHKDTLAALAQVDKAVESLATSLPVDARLIITADHGHLDVELERQYRLEADDQLLSYCDGPPSGDVRLMYVTVRDENIAPFRDLVSARFGDDFVVVTTEEAEQMALFGPGKLSSESRRRIGNLMVISTGSAILDFRAALGEKTDDKGPKPSHHSGLTPAEMRIPLVII